MEARKVHIPPSIPSSIHVGYLKVMAYPCLQPHSLRRTGESAYGFVMSSNLYLVGADATIDQKAYSFKEAEARVIVFVIYWIGVLQ